MDWITRKMRAKFFPLALFEVCLFGIPMIRASVCCESKLSHPTATPIIRAKEKTK